MLFTTPATVRLPPARVSSFLNASLTIDITSPLFTDWSLPIWRPGKRRYILICFAALDSLCAFARNDRCFFTQSREVKLKPPRRTKFRHYSNDSRGPLLFTLF